MIVNFDRKIYIDRRVVVKDATYGSQTVTWSLHAHVWSEWRDALPSRAESVRNGLEQAFRQVRIRIRWRDDIDSTMRIRYDDRTLQIVGGPAELGRREYLEMMAEDYATAGIP